MNQLLEKVLTHPANQPVLHFLKIDKERETLYFKTWEESAHPLDEGGSIFFEKYGQYLPEACKYFLETHNLMIHEATGKIFAVLTGRFSIFFRCHFKRSGLTNTDNYRKGYTFDCLTDIRELGENWSFMTADFEEEEAEQLHWAYELVQQELS